MIAKREFFSSVYRKFTRLYQVTEVREEEEPRVPEKVIRCVWNDQLFKTEDLATLDGKPLEVVFPGYWNFGAGPDFKSAAIRVEGQLYEGDVELHVHGTDWRSHGHSNNNDFDNVILHVFLWKERGLSRPSDSNKEHKGLARPHIFDLELKRYLKKGILQLNEELDFDSYPQLNPFNFGLCHRPLSALSSEKFQTLLNNAGDARIQTKMDRFHDRVILKGYEQTFYEGVAEAMGYPSNKAPFQNLAERLPLDVLRKEVPESSSEEERVRHIQALMFGISGLVDFDKPPQPAWDKATRDYFLILKALWNSHRPGLETPVMEREDWKFGHMRPANLPHRRIAALSHLVARYWASGMFAFSLESLNRIEESLEDTRSTAKAVRQCYQLFCLEADDYWARHYTLGGKQLKQNQMLIGADRSREVVINILLPIGLIYARAGKSESLENTLSRIFQTQRPPANNKWIRFMKRYLLGDEEKMVQCLNSDRQTQGLMQVYQDFCTKNENNCLRCKFPGVVERYFS